MKLMLFCKLKVMSFSGIVRLRFHHGIWYKETEIASPNII